MPQKDLICKALFLSAACLLQGYTLSNTSHRGGQVNTLVSCNSTTICAKNEWPAPVLGSLADGICTEHVGFEPAAWPWGQISNGILGTAFPTGQGMIPPGALVESMSFQGSEIWKNKIKMKNSTPWPIKGEKFLVFNTKTSKFDRCPEHTEQVTQ